MDIRTKGVENADELKKTNDLLARIHAEGDYPGALRWLESCGAAYPSYLREHTRIAVSKKEIVGGLRLLTDTIRVGEARLTMGGLGWVSTGERHRKKGICRRLMDDTLAYMRAHGYHVSMLFAIPDFYHRFGYTATIIDHTITVDTVEALTFENSFKVRRAKPGDIPALIRIHEANDRDTVCSVVRSSGHMAARWDFIEGLQVLLDPCGKVIGYYMASVQKSHLAVRELGIEERGLSAAILHAAGETADAADRSTIRFSVPPSHPFAHYLLQFKSRHETRIDRDEGGMLAFINMGETLELMVPEWESCIADSPVRDMRTEMTLIVDGATYRIRANRGAIDVAGLAGRNKITITDADLMHLVTGYRYPEDILDRCRTVVTSEARALFRAIFPKRAPYVWPADMF
ncbi:MAG: GNAT family N-acetyltransferase [bacterium]|nr:GNAT family N-acetyltransferase [bacterium]